MKVESGERLKLGIWGVVAGAVVAIVAGFWWGGWTTAGGAQRLSDEAVLATRAAICAAQFMSQPDGRARLKTLKDANSWDRAALVEKGGWDRMPGESTASASVSRACADRLEAAAAR